MMLEIVRAIGEHFSPETYLVLTRIEGTIWTLADMVIVLFLFLNANLLRRHLGCRRHRFSFLLLGATVPFAMLLPFAQTGMAFFRLEVIVTMPHFALILYGCFANAPLVARLLQSLPDREMLAPHRGSKGL